MFKRFSSFLIILFILSSPILNSMQRSPDQFIGGLRFRNILAFFEKFEHKKELSVQDLRDISNFMVEIIIKNLSKQLLDRAKNILRTKKVSYTDLDNILKRLDLIKQKTEYYQKTSPRNRPRIGPSLLRLNELIDTDSDN